MPLVFETRSIQIQITPLNLKIIIVTTITKSGMQTAANLYIGKYCTMYMSHRKSISRALISRY